MFDRLKAIIFIMVWGKWFTMVQELADCDDNVSDVLKKYGLN